MKQGSEQIAKEKGSAGSGNNDEKNLDFTDTNTVNEVKLAYEYVKEIDCLDTSKDGNEQWEDAMKRFDYRYQIWWYIVACSTQ